MQVERSDVAQLAAKRGGASREKTASLSSDVQNRTVKTASFDVFDTVLTRSVSPPTVVFFLLGRRISDSLPSHCSPEAFAYARVQAERRAVENKGCRTSLRDIYLELADALQFGKEQARYVMEAECALEAELLRPVPEALARLKMLRERGERIAFVSDMYLPAAFIQQQLARHGLWEKRDVLYVSCEHGEEKGSGKLIRKVLQAEDLPASQVVHYGNNAFSDVKGARKAGVAATFLDAANANRYEQILESHALRSDGLSAALAGASRAARLTVPAPDLRERALRDVAAGVMAPMLVGYVLWILRRAQQEGLRRLYFVSREGQVLLDIARQLAGKLSSFDIELRYLYGSRQSWNRTAITHTDQAWRWHGAVGRTSVNDLLDRLGLRPELVEAPLAEAGFDRETWSRPLVEQERDALAQLLEREDVRERVARVADEKKRTVLRYLEQEGLFDGVAKGFVDVGWKGSLHAALCELLQENEAAPIKGFFFGMQHHQSRWSAWREAYFFDKPKQRGYCDVLPGFDLVILTEMFCAADHGTVVDFEERRGRVEPVLQQEWGRTAAAWGIAVVREATHAFAEHLLLLPNLINPWTDVRAAITELVCAFWLTPTPSEAEAWGRFPRELGQGNETYVVELAAPYGWEQAAAVAKGDPKAFHVHNYTWVEASKALTPLQIRRIIGSAEHFSKFSRRLKQATTKRLRHLAA